jgi:hypothetical protein
MAHSAYKDVPRRLSFELRLQWLPSPPHFRRGRIQILNEFYPREKIIINHSYCPDPDILTAHIVAKIPRIEQRLRRKTFRPQKLKNHWDRHRICKKIMNVRFTEMSRWVILEPPTPSIRTAKCSLMYS